MILLLLINDLLKTRVKILKGFEYNSNGMTYDITVLNYLVQALCILHLFLYNPIQGIWEWGYPIKITKQW